MTRNSSFKKRVRARMKETGEKYTEARRALEEEERPTPGTTRPNPNSPQRA
jgi:hypothetical protein